MSPTPVICVPAQSEIDECVARLASREELGAYEAITAVQTYVIPSLRCAGHDIVWLGVYAGDCAIVTVQQELGRLIGLERQALAGRNSGECPDHTRRRANLELMQLLVGARIHRDVAIV